MNELDRFEVIEIACSFAGCAPTAYPVLMESSLGRLSSLRQGEIEVVQIARFVQQAHDTGPAQAAAR